MRIVVVGAGGFAREVRWLISDLRATGSEIEFVGFVVSDLGALGKHDGRDDLLGDYDWLRSHDSLFDGFALGIGTPGARIKVGRELAEAFPDKLWPALVHPTVQMDRDSCEVDRAVIVCAGTIATVAVTIERFAMVNLACTLGHEARVGQGCVLNPTVNISGGAQLGEGVLVGTGAQILQYVSVGDGAIVGAGAVVTRDVHDGDTVVGVPAKPLNR